MANFEIGTLGACPNNRRILLAKEGRVEILSVRMSKTFRAWKIDEPLFLPPTVGDFVAKDHLARFVLSLVRDDIDLAEITGTYGSERGQPPFDPTMMTALLLYSYCCGIYSSRRIAKACRERVDFMSIVGLDAPDFRTISDFRKRHLKALGELFGQILQLCETAGLVKLGHVALDGTKIKANASKHKAMSYERMEKRAAELEAEVAKWLERGRGGGRRGGQAARPRQDRRRDAEVGRRQEAACRENPPGQGRTGGGGEGGGRGQAQGSGRGGREARSRGAQETRTAKPPRPLPSPMPRPRRTSPIPRAGS